MEKLTNPQHNLRCDGLQAWLDRGAPRTCLPTSPHCVLPADTTARCLTVPHKSQGRAPQVTCQGIYTSDRQAWVLPSQEPTALCLGVEDRPSPRGPQVPLLDMQPQTSSGEGPSSLELDPRTSVQGALGEGSPRRRLARVTRCLRTHL